MNPSPDRHSRQTRFRPIGADGQRRLGASTALVVGVGALGSHVTESLARAGVGRLVLVDRDVVELQNLQRQVLFDEDDAERGTPKAIAAARRLGAIASHVQVEALVADFDAATFARLDPRPHVVVDGTDNFATRFLINDLAVRDGIPWIYGGAVGSTGRAMVVLPGITPCLRCLMPDGAAVAELGTCETEGILEPVVAHVAAFQSAEAIKLLCDGTATSTRGMLVVDVWSTRLALVLRTATPRAGCATCGTREFPSLIGRRADAVTMCGRDAVQIRPALAAALDLAALARQLARAIPDVELTEHLLRFPADGCRLTVFPDGRALVFGSGDPLRARALYDRWVGTP